MNRSFLTTALFLVLLAAPASTATDAREPASNRELEIKRLLEKVNKGGAGKDDLAALGDHFTHERRFAEGARYLDQAVSMGVDNTGTWCCLGTCRGRIGKHKEGIDAFSSALKINPRSVDALRGRAALYLCLPDIEAAFADLDRLKQIPGFQDRRLADTYEDSMQFADNKLLQARGWVHASKIESRFRCATLEKRITSSTSDEEKANLLARKSFKELVGGAPVSALKDCDRGLALKSDSIGLRLSRAAALQALDRAAEAKMERHAIVELYAATPRKQEELRALLMHLTD